MSDRLNNGSQAGKLTPGSLAAEKAALSNMSIEQVARAAGCEGIYEGDDTEAPKTYRGTPGGAMSLVSTPGGRMGGTLKKLFGGIANAWDRETAQEVRHSFPVINLLRRFRF